MNLSPTKFALSPPRQSQLITTSGEKFFEKGSTVNNSAKVLVSQRFSTSPKAQDIFADNRFKNVKEDKF
jgi:hypothetical protein